MEESGYITISKESYNTMNDLLIERANRLTNLRKEIICLQKQLDIATKALKEYSWGNNWLDCDCRGQVFLPTKRGYSIADKALEEMEDV